MSRLVLIDGNSILNRAFYGIMGSKMLMTTDGKYTNAVYGFLAIMFKVMDDLNPEYMVVTFDLKAPTARHKLYKEYKATRHGMPNELAEQMPILKEILEAMHIKVIEKEGYEADDVLGTLSKYGEKQGLDVTVVSGDRDTFQLASDKITIRIPRTKVGKTEVEDYDKNAVIEKYGVEPKALIEVKGLQGDTSDNIPGVPGVGEKTALSLIKKYGSIDKLYEMLEMGKAEVKGKMKENLESNKELAFLSRTLGTINREVPINADLEEYKVEPWDEEKVLAIFKELNFNRFIERFHMQGMTEEKEKKIENLFQIIEIAEENHERLQKVIENIEKAKEMIYFLGTKEDNDQDKIIKKQITGISLWSEKANTVYYYKIGENLDTFIQYFKPILENEEIKKLSYQMSGDYVIFRELGIKATGFTFDAEIAAYDINPTNIKYHMEEVASQYLNLEINDYIENIKNAEEKQEETQEQMNLFDKQGDNIKEVKPYREFLYVYAIGKLQEVTIQKLKEMGSLELFQDIEMPLVEVLGDMQYNGMYVDKKALARMGKKLRGQINDLTQEIYELTGEQFNINSTKQLGEVLFEKLKLPVYKKTKKGYATDVDVLEKLRREHPVIPKILEYRQLMKLNSTYVEGLMPYINPKTGRIHSYFHQTVTATGRISSTEPNLQNIPTRIELGKRIRSVFKPNPGSIFIDADYSQIELRVLAHISEDEHMVEAFNHNEDIHKQAASKVFNVPMEQVTKEQRTSAKAVNFGIVYGISDFGLAEQIDVPRKKAKEYIEQYLEKYSGIKQFMNDIVEKTKETGYVETLFHRRRYIPEISSNNYMIRQFGNRAAMNTPIQGTAADIMKIAMIHVYQEMKEKNMKSKIVLQVHDELLIETVKEEVEEIKNILKNCMESAITLKVPLKVDLSEAKNWYDAK